MQSPPLLALQLVASSTSPVFSKIGGLPNLPPDLDWPHTRKRSIWGWQKDKDIALDFIAQLALNELPAGSVDLALPQTGYLYFFYDSRQEKTGLDPQDIETWRVLFSQVGPETTVRPAPASLGDGPFDEKPVRFVALESFPGCEYIGGHVIGAEKEALIDAMLDRKKAAYHLGPHHQVGGYPDVELLDDYPMESLCQLASNGVNCTYLDEDDNPRAGFDMQKSDWKLLLQVDSDNDTGMTWGKGGLIHFWIRQSDLKQGNFDRVWLILQTDW